jgi:hypothetical protein
MTDIGSVSKIVLKFGLIILVLTLANNGVGFTMALTMCLHDVNACTKQQ